MKKIILLFTCLFLTGCSANKNFRAVKTKTPPAFGPPALYLADTGQWQPVDTTIVQSSVPNYQYMNRTNGSQVYFAKTTSAKDAIKLQKDGAELSFKTSGDFEGQDGQASANQIRYSDRSKKIDLIYTVENYRLQEQIVLTEPELPRISEEIYLTNAYAKLATNQITIFHQQTNELLWTIEEPSMYEQANKTVSSTDLTYRVRCLTPNTLDQCRRISLEKVLGDQALVWLKSAERIYPIVIDPTISTSTSATTTAYSFQRKTWFDGTRYWGAFHNNGSDRIEFWYSANESTWTENTNARISVDTNDLSIDADSANAFVSYTNGFDIEARQTSWWDTTWPYRFKYTLANSGVGETLQNFPLRIDLTNDAPAAFWTHVHSHGHDIRIIDKDGTNLTTQAHLDGFNYGATTGNIWVKKTILASTGTDYVWIYYGNLMAEPQWNEAATYNTNYVMVHHFNGTAYTNLLDSTTNNNDVSGQGDSPTYWQTGAINAAVDLDGSNDYLTVADNANLSGMAAITLETIIYPDAIDSGDTFLGKGSETTGASMQYRFGFYNYGSGTMGFCKIWTTVSNYEAYTNAAFPTGSWNYWACRYNGSAVNTWLNGTSQTGAPAASGTVASAVNPIRIGVYPTIDWGGWYNGRVDELRISNIARSNEWLDFAYISDSGGGGTSGSEEGSYPGTAFGWTDATVVYDGSSATDEYDYPAISRDANNKVLITATHHSTTNYLFKANKSTAANSITGWETAATLDTSTNTNKYGTLASVGTAASANMYAVWIDNTTLEGKKYAGVGTTGWAGSADSIGTGLTGLTNSFSLAADSSGNAHLTYIDSSGYAQYQQYTTAWQAAVALDGNAGNEYPSVAIDTAGSDGIYAFWIRGDVIYYRRACSPYTSWGDATTFQGTGTNDWVSTGLKDFGSGKIFALWTQGSGSPYSIIWNSLTPTTCTAAPTSTPTPTPRPGGFQFEGLKMEGVKIE